jgi:hypothetical protein
LEAVIAAIRPAAPAPMMAMFCVDLFCIR